MAICLIPARGGSQRIPRKNIRDFLGKPIMAYSIELGLKTCEGVIVSTDDDEIAAVAKAYGAQVHERSPALARDEIGTQEVARAVIEDLGLEGQICVLYATAPLLTSMNILFAAAANEHDPDAMFRYSADIYGDTTGGFFIGDYACFLAELDPYAYGLPWPTADIDINVMEDWERAEQLYREMYENE